MEVAMRYVLALVLSLALMPLAAVAEGALPKSVQSKVRHNATGYVADLTVLIEGFGQDGAIDAQGLRNVVLLARAEARALAFRRLQGADLDGDGAITGAEVAVAAAAASAVARGRLKVNFAAADGDGDGRVTSVELQAYANEVALAAFSSDKEAAMLAVLQFDGDGNGWVSVSEVQAAVAALSASFGQDRMMQNQFQAEAHAGQDKRAEQENGPGRRGLPAQGGAI